MGGKDIDDLFASGEAAAAAYDFFGGVTWCEFDWFGEGWDSGKAIFSVFGFGVGDFTAVWNTSFLKKESVG